MAQKDEFLNTLRDQVVIVTGASSGIGEATALLLAEKGAKVVLASRNAGKLALLAKRIEEKGGSCLAVPTDVTSPEGVGNLLQKTLDRFKTVDVLVNNAGVSLVKPAADTAEAEMRSVMETNFWGPVRCAKAVIPTMTAKGKGQILNILSQSGRIGTSCQSFYSASKFALAGFSESLRQELRPHGIAVSMVFPGFVQTPMSEAPLKAARKAGISLHPVSAGTAAEHIVKAIRCRKEEVTFPAMSRLMIIAHFFCPKTVEKLISMLRKRMYG